MRRYISVQREGKGGWGGNQEGEQDGGVMQGREKESQGARDASVVGTEGSRSGGETRFEGEDLPLNKEMTCPVTIRPSLHIHTRHNIKPPVQLSASKHWLLGWISFGGTNSRV